MGYKDHLRQSRELVVRCALITLSDTRTPETDKSGRRLRELLESERHVVVRQQIIPDDSATLDALLNDLLADDRMDAILTTGGTGVSRRDATIEVVDSVLDQTLPGFGELFRMLSWKEIGSGVLLSRATAGVSNGKLIFALPGATAAVELAMTQLILPQIKHLVFELRK